QGACGADIHAVLPVLAELGVPFLFLLAAPAGVAAEGFRYGPGTAGGPGGLGLGRVATPRVVLAVADGIRVALPHGRVRDLDAPHPSIAAAEMRVTNAQTATISAPVTLAGLRCRAEKP